MFFWKASLEILNKNMFFQTYVIFDWVKDEVTAEIIKISPNFLEWKFYGNAQNSVETVGFHKISTRGNSMKFRYFT